MKKWAIWGVVAAGLILLLFPLLSKVFVVKLPSTETTKCVTNTLGVEKDSIAEVYFVGDTSAVVLYKGNVITLPMGQYLRTFVETKFLDGDLISYTAITDLHMGDTLWTAGTTVWGTRDTEHYQVTISPAYNERFYFVNLDSFGVLFE